VLPYSAVRERCQSVAGRRRVYLCERRLTALNAHPVSVCGRDVARPRECSAGDAAPRFLFPDTFFILSETATGNNPVSPSQKIRPFQRTIYHFSAGSVLFFSVDSGCCDRHEVSFAAQSPNTLLRAPPVCMAGMIEEGTGDLRQMCGFRKRP